MKIFPNSTRIKMLNRLWVKLSRRRRWQFGLLFILMVVSAFAEVFSLGAVIPFIAVLTNPDHLFNYPAVAKVSGFFGIEIAAQIVLPITIIFIVAVCFSSLIRLLLLWVNARLALACGADISFEVYRRSLYQPYKVHLERHSSEVISSVTNKTNVVSGILSSLLNMISSIVLLGSIICAFIVIDPVIAFLAAGAFGSSYAFITWQWRRKLFSNSQLIASKQTQVIKALQEGMGGIRDVLLDGTQLAYCQIYRQADLPIRRAMAINGFIGQSPRYVIEAVGVIFISILAYSLGSVPGGLIAALPTLGALALGAQRLLPALQQAYVSFTSIAGNIASLSDVLKLLEQPLPDWVDKPVSQALAFNDAIEFDQVKFRYRDDGPMIIENLSLRIPKGCRVGVVGSTGGGKSTTLDLLMGLLEPNDGDILVDGISVKGSYLKAWQKNIAHVPQSIYLADATLAENIAFGIPIDRIDRVRVQKAAEMAQIANFISRNQEGYGAFVGEHGIRLSGGQRQRIGIARALYKEASVLILDEATSALDSKTEMDVMRAIKDLDRDLTIIIIAHRISTLQNCDLVIEVEKGRIKNHGSYDDYLEGRKIIAQ